MMSFNDADELSGFHVEFQFALDTDDEESSGARDVSFDGDVGEGTLVDGLIRGTLSGQFDVLTDKQLRAPATIETFSRRGLLAFLVVTVQDDSGRTSFSANLRPTTSSIDPTVALREVRGTVFLGWDDPGRAAGIGG
jgi:hypothetical protein